VIETRRTNLGSVVNEGARLAWLKMRERDWDQSKLRAEIKAQTGKEITSGALVKYLYCDRRPGVQWTIVFETVLGIAPAQWHQEPSVPFAPPAAEKAA